MIIKESQKKKIKHDEKQFNYEKDSVIKEKQGKKNKEETSKEATKNIAKPRSFKTYNEQRKEHDTNLWDNVMRKIELQFKELNLGDEDFDEDVESSEAERSIVYEKSQKAEIMPQDERIKKYEMIARREEEKRMSMESKPKDDNFIIHLSDEETRRNNNLKPKRSILVPLKRKMTKRLLYQSDVMFRIMNLSGHVCPEFDNDGCDICDESLQTYLRKRCGEDILGLEELIGRPKDRKKIISCYDKDIQMTKFQDFKEKNALHIKNIQLSQKYKYLQFKEESSTNDLLEQKIIEETRSVICERDKAEQRGMIAELVKENVLTQAQLQRTREFVKIINQEKMKTFVYPTHRMKENEIKFKNGRLQSFRQGYKRQNYKEIDIKKSLVECLYAKHKTRSLTSQHLLEMEVPEENCEIEKWLESSSVDSGISTAFSGLVMKSMQVVENIEDEEIHDVLGQSVCNNVSIHNNVN